MKAFILKQEDFDQLADHFKVVYVPLLENGTVDEHRKQAREFFLEKLKSWIGRVTS